MDNFEKFRVTKMPVTVKLNEWEQEALEARLNYLNKKLVMNGFKTIKTESHIVHKIIEMTINKVEIDENGNIKIVD